jgi:transcriptional regulator with XRE-family HTH domain
MLKPRHNGSALRKTRQKLGLSVRQMAQDTGISFGHLAGIERGERDLTPRTLAHVVAALDKMPLPPEDDELLADLASPVDLLRAEAERLAFEMRESAERARAGTDAPLNAHFASHLARRLRAILRAVRAQVDSLPGRAS